MMINKNIFYFLNVFSVKKSRASQDFIAREISIIIIVSLVHPLELSQTHRISFSALS